jgi:hypothetical protein
MKIEAPIEKPSNQNLASRIEAQLWHWKSSENVGARWFLEIVSWCVSFLCMGGIIVVLLLLNNKQSKPLPGNITLNTFVSVLSRMSAAAMMLPTAEALGQLKWSWFQPGGSKKLLDFEIFDEASRGPWGSFLLLMRTKGRSVPISTDHLVYC